ncbi:acyl carrier protein [Plantactinospora endophytica]|uniref:Acyl carrier protein n=1 Tax=Plantactinospora endophytica TaxID=673535 RepID=A0ABQ4E3I4_9ACTN|nr:acyl carrier protein [Plantactinospora endophytica]GIG89271.1 acyl carrier protein [Plantactinospora endophytica]
MQVNEASILADITEMLQAILGDDAVDGEITMATRFQDDLAMESIDVISLAGRLQVRYGDRVNFAQLIAGFDLESVRQLRVGQLVEHIVAALDGADASPGKAGTPA